MTPMLSSRKSHKRCGNINKKRLVPDFWTVDRHTNKKKKMVVDQDKLVFATHVDLSCELKPLEVSLDGRKREELRGKGN